MEKKIYKTLVLLSTITVIITTIILSYFFFDFFKSNGQAKNINYVLTSVGPLIVSILIFLFIFLYIISSKLAQKIMEPIEEASKSLERVLSNSTITDNIQYKEIKPFISSLNRYREEVKYYILKLEETDRLRREFTANISHELKTPLTSINGYAELISSGITNEEDNIKFGKIIYDEGNRLLAIIDSIISLSNLDDPDLDLDFQLLELDLILDNIIYRLRPIMQERNIELIKNIEKTKIYGNSRMIHDLILNILSNSIKYNKPNGKIYIDSIDSPEYSILTIEDTGVGICESDIPRIFERFYIANKSRSNIEKSTGLGLAIVKHIVDIHNGYIEVDSQVDVGTKIKIGLKKAPS